MKCLSFPASAGCHTAPFRLAYFLHNRFPAHRLGFVPLRTQGFEGRGHHHIGQRYLTQKKRIYYLEHADFSQGDFLYDRVIFRFQKSLDGHDLTRVPVSALEHHPVGAFSNLPNFFIFLHLRGVSLENGLWYSF